MNDDLKRNPVALRSIFHPSDFSQASEVAFAHALKLALRARAELTVLHVTPKVGSVYWSDFPGIRRTLERWEMLPPGSSPEDVAKLGLRVQKIVGSHSDPVLATLHYLSSDPADLIVLASHQREGRVRWLQKSVAEPIARQSHHMTLFVPHGTPGFVSVETGKLALRRILVPVDKDPRPQPAVEAAAALPPALGCSGTTFGVLYVGRRTDMPSLRIPENGSGTWERFFRKGDVVEQILDTCDEFQADLIVMTTQGHHGFLDALRGSTTERVLRGARCPVLAIPAA